LHVIDEKVKMFKDDYDGIIDYLFNNWVIIQNNANNGSSDTALKIANYAIYYAHKLKDKKNDQMWSNFHDSRVRRKRHWSEAHTNTIWVFDGGAHQYCKEKFWSKT
jgi:hypothetical protein